jgi:hypothetical protein
MVSIDAMPPYVADLCNRPINNDVEHDMVYTHTYSTNLNNKPMNNVVDYDMVPTHTMYFNM